MLRRSFVQLLVVLAVTGAVQAAERIAFEDVTVVPMDSERLLPGQTVLVEGERIVWIAPYATAVVPEGTRRIEAKGQFLMPGLADMHIHIPPEGSDEAAATKEFWLFVAHGVTTARVMIGQPEHLALRDRVARGELFGPRLYVAGPPLGIKAGALPGVPELKTLDDARRVPAEQKKAGYDFVKILDDLTLEQYDALVAGCREAGIPLVGHVPDSVSLEHALASQASIEHLAGYVEALIPADLRNKPGLRLSEVLDKLELARLPEVVAATRKANGVNVPTLFFWSAYVSSDTPERLATRGGLEFVSTKEKAGWAEQRTKSLARNPNPTDYAPYHALRARLTKALADADATLLLGTDSPDFYTVAGVATHEELARLVAAGLTPYQALRGGTRDAAAFVHAEREFGTVAPGLPHPLGREPPRRRRHLARARGRDAARPLAAAHRTPSTPRRARSRGREVVPSKADTPRPSPLRAHAPGRDAAADADAGDRGERAGGGGTGRAGRRRRRRG
jgi:imidazolonepropionase-like amidohydrolase